MPVLEEREAAIFGHYNWSDWQKLTRHERVFAVAHYRLHHLIQLHSDDAVEEEIEARRRRASSR